ncbi:MAG: hypothetical protein AAGA44_04290 [Pseudomonadota bacterium]
MIGDTSEVKDDVDGTTTDDDEDRMIEDDDIVEATAEINVDDIVSKIDAQSDIERQRDIRRRLEELREERLSSKDLESTYNFSLDDDL